MKHKFIYYRDYQKAVKHLVNQIKQSKETFDSIVMLVRGGVFLAGSLSYQLHIKDLIAWNIQTFNSKKQRLKTPKVLHDLPPKLLHGKNTLIVDDICDQGLTLQCAKKYFEESVDGTYKIATLCYRETAIVKPDYFSIVLTEDDPWITFWWDSV